MWLTTDGRRIASWACAGVVLVGALVLGSGGVARADGAAVDRLAAIMDYLQSDYPGAVAAGRVVAAAEYQEQRGLLEEARSLTVLAAPLPGHEAARAALTAGVEALIKDFGDKVPEPSLAADCRRVADELFDDYGLAVGPLQPPLLQRGRDLYLPSCAPCHGQDGLAQTENARKLSPPPVSFMNDARMRRISPRLAFEALEYGVGNTAMASFAALPAADRWSLAFRVVAWRHQTTAAELDRGATLFRSLAHPLAATPSRLGALTDAEIEARLDPDLESPADRAAVVAWLRDVASFEPDPAGPFRAARAALRALDDAAADRARAPAIAERISRDVRPRLLLLRLRDHRLARRLTDQLELLRRAASAPDEVALRGAIVRTSELLDRAEEQRWGVPAPGALIGCALLAMLLATLGWRLARSRGV